MKCKKCGSEVTGKFCSQCGANNSSLDFDKKKKWLLSCRKESGSNAIWFVLDILMLIPLLYGCIFLFGTITSERLVDEVQICVIFIILFVIVKIQFKLTILINMVSSYFSLQTEEQLQKIYAEMNPPLSAKENVDTH